jgi:putative ABC transport system ATP-binding protein
MAVLETKNLSKTYGAGDVAVRALKEVSLCFEPDRFYAVLGRSGSGKTTLLNLLGGLDTPTGGTVLLEGTDLYALADEELAAVR